MAAPCIYYIDGKEFTKEQFLGYVKKSNTTTVKETIDSGIKAIDTKLQTLRDALKDVNSRIDIAAKSDESYAKPTDKDFGKRYNAQANARQVDDVRLLADRRSNIQSEYNRLTDERARIADTYPIKATPPAPFVTDTNAWTKLGLKVALKEAVKQGAEKIGWTTGEQQNDRYDLSKQVDWINAEKTQKGDYKIEVGHKDNRPMETQYLKENELEPNLGKELATKIINDGGGMYKGLDLKVGGKGMKGFYGSPTEKSLGIVGNVAKSLFKQEPKTTKIETKDKFSGSEKDISNGTPLSKQEAKDFYYSKKGVNDGLIYAVKENGKAVELNTLADINETSPYDRIVKVIPEKATEQHSIDITPELKASVAGGQPLFKDAEAQYRIENGKNIVEAIKDFDGSPRATVALTHEIMHPTVVAIIDGAKEGNHHTNCTWYVSDSRL